MVTIVIDIPQILGLLGLSIGVYYLVRRKIHKIRIFVDSVDDALYDDKVTEDEFRKIWETGKAVVKKENGT